MQKIGGGKMRQWIFAGLILQMVFIGSVEAKDYSTDLGPYHLDFSLDDSSILAQFDVSYFGKATNIITDPTTGIKYYAHRLAAKDSLPPASLEFTIYEYPKPLGRLDLEKVALTHQKILEKRYYRACESREITIDGHEGILTTGLAGWSSPGDVYMFAYAINNRTQVTGICYLDLNKTVEPILKSLHVTLRPVKGDADGDNFLDWSYDYARGNITFIADYPPLHDPVIVPAGTRIYAIRENDKVYFTTTEDGIIEIGQMEVTVPVKAEVDGPYSNVDAYSILILEGYLVGIYECENREPVAVLGV